MTDYERVREWKMKNRDKVREQKKRYKQNHPEYRRKERTRYKKTLTGKRMRKHQFIGIDGEGWNDKAGSHNYHMIVTSNPDVFICKPEPLTTYDCLSFIADLPTDKHIVIVSYFFDYDVTMILRDMAQSEPETAAKLFKNSKKYVWYKGFGIKYTPHKSFSVKRYTDDNTNKVVTIHDTGTFFQQSFVSALTKFKIGTLKERDAIQNMKQQRGTFTPEQMQDVLTYSQHECSMLVKLAERLRDLSEKAGLNAYPYEGPGAMASRALTQYYGKKLHHKTIDKIPDELKYVLPFAMYGGRFETTCVGAVRETVYEYDRHSAYPAIMSELPCLFHGKWLHSKTVDSDYALTYITFNDVREPEPGICYPLPIRKQSGELQYPRNGAGWYWESEYKHVGTLEYQTWDRWAWIPGHCVCKPFGWIKDLFEQREQMERESKGSGIALKLALNTLYGKCAQTRPVDGPWLNFAYASLITSALRTDMYNLYRQLPDRSVYMFATDAIFTSEKLPVTHGLGGLELADTYHDLTIVQPGLYFDSSIAHFKTRGIPKKYIQQYSSEICVAAVLGTDYPMKVTSFYGLRLALSTGRLNDMGQWLTNIRMMSTRTESKRRTVDTCTTGKTVFTIPAPNTNDNNGESKPRKFGLADIDRMTHEWESDDETMVYDG